MRSIDSLIRLALGFVFVGTMVTAMLLGCLVLLPFGRKARILLTNYLGTYLGRGILAISGSKVTIHGRENLELGRPVIFANNHTSNLDAFLTIWLTPLGTVGLAKKEIIYYPFYGLAWTLCGHPTVDRSNPERARKSMQQLGEFVQGNQLSVCMLPEGTRSRNGKLLPFKKGVVHLAIQAGLPIVPMVTIGATGAWNKGQWTIQPRDIHVHFLSPIDTKDWDPSDINGHLAELRERFVEQLPPEMLSPADKTLPTSPSSSSAAAA